MYSDHTSQEIDLPSAISLKLSFYLSYLAFNLHFPVDTDRLVCPITNGMVWGPVQLQLDDLQSALLAGGRHSRRFEFDLTASHLTTIVNRCDLDIVVCSHLISEPLQVCHWPPADCLQIRFNEVPLQLDRHPRQYHGPPVSSTCQGQTSTAPAHKVACVKQLCRPGRNCLEISVIGLGEEPNIPGVAAKRRAIFNMLKTVLRSLA
ncbi:unnamed protein product [Protopolystoma xenopodis]|uniref:ZMIZ1/ZMIZ2 GBD-like domain-containing protein n=1 Tax=Protopolystoma xenopodis TaxID=117903 RepID=A0A448WDH2_9PLAT|nr:unnamed protein product [Protopolystoma xenopodis]